MKNKSKIKVGIIGIGRGKTFIKGADLYPEMELVAICDHWEEKLNEVCSEYNVKGYTDYDRFLEHDMDAVILANYFHEHAPFAIKALEAGKHVMSETACNSTLAEGVNLCRAVEKSGKIYMLAENYPFTKFNLEMKRIYETKEIGEVTYAEGEYNHPMSPELMARLAPGLNHWRNLFPSTYYCTHALAPLMYITKRMPKKINALSIENQNVYKKSTKRSDPGAVILIKMDNGSVFRLFGISIPGHSNWYRIHGECGAMENVRGPGYFGPEQVRVWHDEWDLKPGQIRERTYVPEWISDADKAEKSGHGGGDFWTVKYFSEAIKENKQPFLDVYRGVAMSSVGILAWKSALSEGAPFDMPDFSNEDDRKKYENDNWTPFYSNNKKGDAPTALAGERKPTQEDIEYAEQIWKKNDVDKNQA